MKTINTTDAYEHFVNRAKIYNKSSSWVLDKKFLDQMVQISEVKQNDKVLDLAVGTGMVSKFFKPYVDHITGIDICEEMALQSKDSIDQFVKTRAESLPFDNASFDRCICRQGLQFMDLDQVFPEVRRVLKDKGEVIFAHLVCYNDEDEKEAFSIQKLRNPARKNYFNQKNLINKLQEHGFSILKVESFFSKESVSRWIENGAISLENINNIKELYKNASSGFLELHKIEFQEDDIIDQMPFQIIKAC